MSEDPYKDEVIDPGDVISQFASEINRQSYKNCPAVTIIPHKSNDFRGPVGWMWQTHILQGMLENHQHLHGHRIKWVMLEEVENDGAGGKPQFHTIIGTEEVFMGLPWEIIEMCFEDFVRSGRFPAIFMNQIDIKSVTKNNLPLFKAAFTGLGKALKKVNLACITGETAIMKHSITAFCDTGAPEQAICTWSGACIGLAHRDKLLDGSKIAPGQPIVGFWEPGYRCNGGTFFTNLLLKIYGSVENILKSSDARAFIEKLCVPSKHYGRTILRLHGWNDDGSIREALANIVGIAHITGGGVWAKLGDLLPNGIGADLNNMPKPADVLLEAQEMSWDIEGLRLTDLQAHGTLHGGCGMFVVAEIDEDAERIIAEAEADGIEAQIVGHTTTSDENEITIVSRFRENRTLSSLELAV